MKSLSGPEECFGKKPCKQEVDVENQLPVVSFPGAISSHREKRAFSGDLQGDPDHLQA